MKSIEVFNADDKKRSETTVEFIIVRNKKGEVAIQVKGEPDEIIYMIAKEAAASEGLKLLMEEISRHIKIYSQLIDEAKSKRIN